MTKIWSAVISAMILGMAFEAAVAAADIVDVKAIQKAPQSSLIVDFGRTIPYGVALVKQRFNNKPAYSVSLFLNKKPYRTMPLPKEIFYGLTSRFEKIYDKNANAALPGPCGQAYSVAASVSGHRAVKTPFCYDRLSRAGQDQVSRWYADIQKIF